MGYIIRHRGISEALLKPCKTYCSYGRFESGRLPFSEIQYEDEVTLYMLWIGMQSTIIKNLVNCHI